MAEQQQPGESYGSVPSNEASSENEQSERRSSRARVYYSTLVQGISDILVGAAEYYDIGTQNNSASATTNLDNIWRGATWSGSWRSVGYTGESIMGKGRAARTRAYGRRRSSGSISAHHDEQTVFLDAFEDGNAAAAQRELDFGAQRFPSQVVYGATTPIKEESMLTTETDMKDDDLSMDDVNALRNSLLEKVENFELPVDPDKGYRAKTLRICSFERPHMRAFHGSWMCFCCAWLIWFSMAPLLPAISDSIEMTKSQLWTSNLLALVGTIIVRVILGPLCDQYGGKDILTALLAACAVPCGLAGILVHNFTGLLVVRSLIGCVGGTLVPAQFWVSSQFAPNCAGVAMATAAGWGALGGGLAQVLMGSLIFPTVLAVLNGNQDLAWRVSLVFPASIAIATAWFFRLYSDDCPLGSYKEVRQAGLLKQRSAVDSFRQGVFNLNAWILFVQFGATLGIELVMESGMTMHLADRFELPLQQASVYASIFGLMNLFARGLGGLMSDRLHAAFSIRGRLYLQMVLLLMEGFLILGFIESDELGVTLVWMAAFAAAGQMSMGTCFGIIPFVDPRCTGTIAGIVGAGGNMGGVFLSNIFRTQSDTYAFHVMAYVCVVSALLTPFITISGFAGILFGSERKNAGDTLLTPAGPRR